jgi:hypothetical protein
MALHRQKISIEMRKKMPGELRICGAEVVDPVAGIGDNDHVVHRFGGKIVSLIFHQAEDLSGQGKFHDMTPPVSGVLADAYDTVSDPEYAAGVTAFREYGGVFRKRLAHAVGVEFFQMVEQRRVNRLVLICGI